MSEGETQYNIPVSSKQLIVYFVFLVIALSAAFLAGVMVGRNVDSSPEPTVRDIQDDRVSDEAQTSPTPNPLTYGSSLQSDKVEGLATPLAATSPKASPPAQAVTLPTAAVAKPTAPAPPRATPQSKATPAPKPSAKPTPSAKATPLAKAGKSPAPTPLSRLTIQVGAFKERSAADAIVKRLKAKGYSAYLVPVSEGLFNVRVGSFTEREDAERILNKLETQEKFKPFIVKP